MLARPIGLLIALAVLGLVFGGLERWFGSTPGPPWYRRKDVSTDLAYWFFTPLVSRAVAGGAVALAALLVLTLGGSPRTLAVESLRRGELEALAWSWSAGALSTLPFALQLLLGLLVADGLSYATHRLFHRRPLWSLHAVHHCSPTLDWLSSVRLHPLNQAVTRVVQALPLLVLGFDPAVFASVAPLLSAYAILLHANVGWDCGPLRYVVATPRFHRWHHTSESEGRDRNFAGLFPIWDLLFGTFHMPRNAVPTRFGSGGEPVPAGLWRQLAYPFRTPRADEDMAGQVI